ncbi:MAG: HAD family phosphatase [Chloroflexaceae bacterium]|jgi:putative hydrolase of the HAD superfamily|nr:HAD family phosphatase [Chloroflexaceae bacterium]
MLKAVIFDIGGVLFRVEEDAPRQAWARRVGLSVKEFEQRIFANPVARRASVGQATMPELWAEIARQLSLTPAEVTQLKAELWRGGVWDAALLAYLKSLRPRYKTAVISDAWPDARENTLRYINSETFDAIFFSAEAGRVKPAPALFQRAFDQLHVHARETVFVDDSADTVLAARQLGLVGIHFTGTAQLLAELHSLLAP